MAGPYLLKKETHCTTILDQLLRDDTFTDVTLTAEGQSIRAHKIVLCLASVYFKQVLSKDPNVQNIIVFRDVKFEELKNLINFVYTGEATVDAAEIESFMRIAAMLEISSFCDGQRMQLPESFYANKIKDVEPDRSKPPSASSIKRKRSNFNSAPFKSLKTNESAIFPNHTSQPLTASDIKSEIAFEEISEDYSDRENLKDDCDNRDSVSSPSRHCEDVNKSPAEHIFLTEPGTSNRKIQPVKKISPGRSKIGRVKNPVSEYFTYNSTNDKSKCNVCLTFMTGNHSANLERHINRHHPEESKELAEKKEKRFALKKMVNYENQPKQKPLKLPEMSGDKNNTIVEEISPLQTWGKW